jgi:transposase-like protein
MGIRGVCPTVIAFVERENSDSWYWFLERLKNMVVQDVQNVCVIHDRHKRYFASNQ